MPNRPRRSYNPKKALVAHRPEQSELAALALKVKYSGNPEHKSNPGDFSLTPPSGLKPDKTNCDLAGIRSRSDALSALRQGVLKGLISSQARGEFPQNIWSVTADGIALEAQLENQEAGTYHGYPMTDDDPFGKVVIRAWETSSENQ
jgi:hypothetical protein